MRKVTVFLIILSVICIIVYAQLTNGEKYLKEVLGKQHFEYSKIVNEKGTPTKEEMVDGYKFVDYEDVSIVFSENGNVFVRAEIKDDSHTFLCDTVKIGAKRKFIEAVYLFKRKIKDLKESEYGFIDHDVWVKFTYNEDNKVEKILMYYGP